MLVLEIKGEPVPKGRPRARIVKRRGGSPYVQVYTPKSTEEAELKISKEAFEQAKIQQWDFAGKKRAIKIYIEFYMKIAGSLSEKKKSEIEGLYCTKNKDLDNLVKTVLDGINKSGCIWYDDSQVVHKEAFKVWSREPKTKIIIKKTC